jgi:hypothetical protein
MKPNLDKIDDAVLGLLRLTSFTGGRGDLAVTRAWRRHDRDALDRLHQQGLISNPNNQNKSIGFTEAGRRRAAELFEKVFA